jgi:hypothetical protein
MKTRSFTVVLLLVFLAAGPAPAEVREGCREDACDQRQGRKPFTDRLPREAPAPDKVLPVGADTVRVRQG